MVDEKKQKIFEKIHEEDYRGLIGVILTAGFVMGVIVTIIVKPDAVPAIASTLGPLAGAAVGWYFREKAGS